MNMEGPGQHRSHSSWARYRTKPGSYNRCDARSSGHRGLADSALSPAGSDAPPSSKTARHGCSHFVGGTHAFVAGGCVAGVASSISATSMSTAQPSGILSLEVAQTEGSASGATLFAWR